MYNSFESFEFKHKYALVSKHNHDSLDLKIKTISTINMDYIVILTHYSRYV